ncbi:serine hydrolase domain-containing protein [Maritalea porphyrae]|uniref:serine hydrolase domain-containing protein n=1 Tax=Maritalea porphyrae TaxID=880732 RepID=UPI0022B0735A|nr:serine hydrolase domain-containing protein [Maritalea porphyrae]MCZ4274137.1 serine hydrolase [Maritalea porphyrae]
MKKLGILAGIVVVIVVGGLMITRIMFGSISAEQAEERITANLEAFIETHDLDSALLRVYAPSKGVTFGLAVGNAEIDSQFHAASLGKTLTATLIYVLAEKGELDVELPISDYLSNDVLKGLFVHQGIDYSAQVTTRMLLNHTSGIGDYFEGPVLTGQPFLDIVAQDLDRLWTPAGLVDFTRTNQTAIGAPGAQFKYSDTGYILLGLIVEHITQQTFFESMNRYVLDPVGMTNTTMPFQSGDIDMLPIIVNGVNFHGRNALSIDWSGGGFVSTTSDLLAFMRALHDGSLINSTSLNHMKSFSYEFDDGIYYGEGMMQFRLSELSPLLRGFEDLYGGVGTTGAFMFTNTSQDIFFILNVGNEMFREQGAEEIVNAMILLDRVS